MRTQATARFLVVLLAPGCMAAPDEAPVIPSVASEAEIESIGNAVYPSVFTKNELRSYTLHMQMTPKRPATGADSLRAASIVDSIERTIRKWKDPKAATAAGFKVFDPESPQDEYHFLRRKSSVKDNRLNYESPTGLLYKKDKNGNFFLVGAMYGTPGTLSEAALDSLIPTSHSRWHRHLNWCFPPLDRQDRWGERNRNGDLIFGMLGVSTRSECEQARGLFRPDIGGWMTHALVYEADIWGGQEVRGMGHH